MDQRMPGRAAGLREPTSVTPGGSSATAGPARRIIGHEDPRQPAGQHAGSRIVGCRSGPIGAGCWQAPAGVAVGQQAVGEQAKASARDLVEHRQRASGRRRRAARQALAQHGLKRQLPASPPRGRCHRA